MTKATRIFIDHACYHIMARGNQKQKVFRDHEDFAEYLSMVKRAKRKYQILLYAYCLMPNHIHLLVEVKSARNISKFMHWMNRGYAAYFNTKYHKVGHLWQSRFTGKPIIKGQYLIHCANYIEANPVRAEIVDDIANYPWSSYAQRCLLHKSDILDELMLEVSLPLELGAG